MGLMSRFALILVLAVWLASGCSSPGGDPAAVKPTVTAVELIRQKSRDVADLLSTQDIPDRFLVRFTDAGSSATFG